MTRPVLTVTEAAAACLVAPKTITRRLPALQEHGASKDSSGQWRIPVEALLAVGLKVGKPKGQDTDRVSKDSDQEEVQLSQDFVTPEIRAELSALRFERDSLLRELVEAERRTADAERRATEAQAQRAEALAEALAISQRQLPPGPTPSPAATTEGPEIAVQDVIDGPELAVQDVVSGPKPAVETPRRRGFWSWLKSE